jgi:hypothetical protein
MKKTGGNSRVFANFGEMGGLCGAGADLPGRRGREGGDRTSASITLDRGPPDPSAGGSRRPGPGWRSTWDAAGQYTDEKQLFTFGAVAFGAVAAGAALAGLVSPREAGAAPPAGGATLTGRAALGDWTTDAPGVRRKITVEDLATPYDTPSVNNGARMVERPSGAWPKAPEGFEVTEFATGLGGPRVIVRAPNGDLFLAESQANRVRVFRDADGDGKPEVSEVFAEGLDRPFGIAFHPPGPDPKYVYVGNTGSVVRFPYRDGATKARGSRR